MDGKIVTFDLAPRNPNVNGIYYDEVSYNLALYEFFSVNQPVYDKYDNDTKDYKSDSHYTVGVILNYIIDDERCSIEVKLDNRLNFISNEDYVIGFKLLTNGTIIDEITGKEKYVIDKILYATLINKDFINE